MRRNGLWMLLALTSALLLATGAAHGDDPGESEGRTTESVFTEGVRDELRSWFGPASQPPHLTLNLVGSRYICLETTQMELVWHISGGVPPYTRTLDGRTIEATAGSAIVTCGPPTADPTPGLEQTFKGGVIDGRGVTAEDELRVALTAPPPRPTLGTVQHGASDGTALRLNWTAVNAVPSVSAYELQYQATAWDATSWLNSWTAISDTIAASTTEYLHRNLDPDQRYRYQLRARNSVDAGEWSHAFPEVGLRPGAPLLEARTAASGSVALSWSAGPTDATRWDYRRRQAGGNWSAWIAITGSNASTAEHTVTGLTEDVRYHFQLRAHTANGASPASATAVAVAGLTPTVPSEREALFYDDLGSTGGAARPGSYAFLKDTDDLTSGAVTFAEVSTAEALLLNASGYGGRNYTEVLSTVQAGDRITWFPYPRCWYHYRVTEILADPPPPARKLFRITLVTADPCGVAAAGASNAKSYFNEFRDTLATFGWDPPPNEPRVGADGIRILPGRYPAEGGRTYRLMEWGYPTPIVIDVPAGMRLITRGGLWSHGPTLYTYVDEATGSTLWLRPYTGQRAGYSVETPDSEKALAADVAARFDAIIASIREVPLPPTTSE